MGQYIPKSAVVAEIERIEYETNYEPFTDEVFGKRKVCKDIKDFLNTLEVKEVDLEKLGEIARHLIAVKEHIEDMRLDKEEWLILEKIGYPEKFKAQKGE